MSMPKIYLCRKRHKLEYTDGNFTQCVVDLLRAYHKSPRQIACDTGIHYERVRSWFNDGTKISAKDLLLLLARYDFFSEALDFCYAQRYNLFIVTFHD